MNLGTGRPGGGSRLRNQAGGAQRRRGVPRARGPKAARLASQWTGAPHVAFADIQCSRRMDQSGVAAGRFRRPLSLRGVGRDSI